MAGQKREKFCITIAFACNANGSKHLPPIYIGKSKLPSCFKKHTPGQLGLYYWNNKKAWMTSELFEDECDIYKINLLQGMLMVREAWKCMDDSLQFGIITTSVIHHCHMQIKVHGKSFGHSQQVK
ncbi:hypothetical protein L208DRAFT_1384121 [Tricholoma matsutake]|nr:hypothetical protein L208DRAFT_1384121 [Tricholoma matsutake 945]